MQQRQRSSLAVFQTEGRCPATQLRRCPPPQPRCADHPPPACPAASPLGAAVQHRPGGPGGVLPPLSHVAFHRGTDALCRGPAAVRWAGQCSGVRHAGPLRLAWLLVGSCSAGQLAISTARPLPWPACAAGRYSQAVAALLVVWVLFGWLLPTLLLLPFQPEPALQPSDGTQRAHRGFWLVALWGRAEAATEAWLRQLLPHPAAPADVPGAAQGADGLGEWALPYQNYRCGLCWLVTLSMSWLFCCLVAPLYGDGGTVF